MKIFLGINGTDRLPLQMLNLRVTVGERRRNKIRPGGSDTKTYCGICTYDMRYQDLADAVVWNRKITLRGGCDTLTVNVP